MHYLSYPFHAFSSCILSDPCRILIPSRIIFITLFIFILVYAFRGEIDKHTCTSFNFSTGFWAHLPVRGHAGHALVPRSGTCRPTHSDLPASWWLRLLSIATGITLKSFIECCFCFILLQVLMFYHDCIKSVFSVCGLLCYLLLSYTHSTSLLTFPMLRFILTFQHIRVRFTVFILPSTFWYGVFQPSLWN